MIAVTQMINPITKILLNTPCLVEFIWVWRKSKLN